MEISWKDFEKIEMRIGTITEVADFPEAKNPAYKMVIDLISNWPKKTSAQITKRYKKRTYSTDKLLPWLIFRKTNRQYYERMSGFRGSG